MSDHKVPERVMPGKKENVEQHVVVDDDSYMGRERRRNKGRIAWHRKVGCLASGGIEVPPPRPCGLVQQSW